MRHQALFIVLLTLCWAHEARSITFEHATWSTQDLVDLKFVQQNSWYTGHNVSQKNDAIWLNPDPSSNLGRVIYKDPIRFLNLNSSTSAQRIASFNTHFTFQIITTAPYPNSGAGMAFFISNSEKAPNNSFKGNLGLVDVNDQSAARFFAVEFDTHKSPAYGESSASHIGIDINSLRSVNTTDTKNGSSPYYPELYLYSNYTFSTWIEYNASAHLTQVWMTNSSSSQRPPQPIMQVSHDLSLDVLEEFMYVGFTAASNNSVEGHVLYSWYFNSDDLIGTVAVNGSDGLSNPANNSSNTKSSNNMVLVIGITLSLTVLLLRQISQALQGDTLLLPVNNMGGSPRGGSPTTALYSHIEAPVSY